MKKINRTDILLLFLIVLLICVLIYGIFTINIKGAECMSDSMTYSLEKLKKLNEADISCTCFAHKPSANYLSFSTVKE